MPKLRYRDRADLNAPAHQSQFAERPGWLGRSRVKPNRIGLQDRASCTPKRNTLNPTTERKYYVQENQRRPHDRCQESRRQDEGRQGPDKEPSRRPEHHEDLSWSSPIAE